MFMIQEDRSAVEYRRNTVHNKIEPQRGSIQKIKELIEPFQGSFVEEVNTYTCY